jgi:citrate lyase subunit beta/citryl-CoA lyase
VVFLDVAVLFCPADRPDRYAKALGVSRSIIIDLEDAVAPGARAEARDALSSALGTHERPGMLDPGRVLVRVNPLSRDDGARDIAALRSTRHRRVLIAKAEDPEAIRALEDLEVVALIETLAGFDALDEIASSQNCVGLMWGGDDFTADLGGRSSRRQDGSLLPHAQQLRLAVLLSAKRHGIVALDGPLLQMNDAVRLEHESRDAAHMGFAAKAAIHPKQVPTIRQAFRPSDEEVARARRIIGLSEEAGGGIATLDGLMIDGPVVLQARSILAALTVD